LEIIDPTANQIIISLGFSFPIWKSGGNTGFY